IVEELSLAPHTERGYSQTLRKMFTCAYIERTGNISSDIRPMAFILGIPNDCTVNKNGADEAHIIHMRSTAIRVVDGKYISRVDVGAELFQDCFALEV